MTTATAAEWRFDAIGTRWRVAGGEPVGPALAGRVERLVAEYDATWSRFRADSAVARIARGGAADLGRAAPALIDLLLDLRERTGGAFDPLVAASLDHLGYGLPGDLRARPGFRPAPAARIERSGTVVRVEPPALLDVGSAGKGQLADLVCALLVEEGHGSVVVDASGDIVVRGDPLRVALEHPFDPTAAIGVVEVEDGAIAGSAVNRRTWEGAGGRRLHHVLDALTGRPVETIAATWVLAADAMTADALATALFLVTPEVLLERYDFRYVRMRTDGVATWSADLPGEVFR